MVLFPLPSVFLRGGRKCQLAGDGMRCGKGVRAKTASVSIASDVENIDVQCAAFRMTIEDAFIAISAKVTNPGNGEMNGEERRGEDRRRNESDYSKSVK